MIKIITKKSTRNRYYATIDTNRRLKAFGNSKEEAVGKLICNHSDYFGFVLRSEDEKTKSGFDTIKEDPTSFLDWLERGSLFDPDSI